MTYEYEKTSIEIVEQYEPVINGGGVYHTGRLRSRAINQKTGNFFAVSHAGGVDDRPSGDYYLGFWHGRWLEIELTFESGGATEETRWTHYTGIRRIRGVEWQDGFSMPDFLPLDEAVSNKQVFFEELKEAIIAISDARDVKFGMTSPRTITFENLN